MVAGPELVSPAVGPASLSARADCYTISNVLYHAYPEALNQHPTVWLPPLQEKVQRLEAQVRTLSERVAELHLAQASYRAQVETLQGRCAAAGILPPPGRRESSPHSGLQPGVRSLCRSCLADGGGYGGCVRDVDGAPERLTWCVWPLCDGSHNKLNDSHLPCVQVLDIAGRPGAAARRGARGCQAPSAPV